MLGKYGDTNNYYIHYVSQHYVIQKTYLQVPAIFYFSFNLRKFENAVKSAVFCLTNCPKFAPRPSNDEDLK